MTARLRFADRAEAGRSLVSVLPRVEGDAVVLGLARGGVPVAAEVARALNAPLDVLVVRKLGHPQQPEYALGAVSEDGVAFPAELPDDLVAPQRTAAQQQAEKLRAGRPALPVQGRVAIVVDDGLATGRSMRTALETVRRRGAADVVMAVPVAAGPGFREVAATCHAVAALVVEPPEFFAVGQFYDDFTQVDDEQVAALLAASVGGSPPSTLGEAHDGGGDGAEV